MDYVSEIGPGNRDVLRRSDQEWIRTVCKIGQGHECCRYLTCGPGGFDCAKHTELRAHLDFRVFCENITARGDNCPGLEKPIQVSPEPPDIVA